MEKHLYIPVTYVNDDFQDWAYTFQEEFFSLTWVKTKMEQGMPYMRLGSTVELSYSVYKEYRQKIEDFVTTTEEIVLDLEWLVFDDCSKNPQRDWCNYRAFFQWKDTTQLADFIYGLNSIVGLYHTEREFFPYVPHVILAANDMDVESSHILEDYYADYSWNQQFVVENVSIVRKDRFEFNEVARYEFDS